MPAVEDGTLTLIGATTENPFFEVNAPLRSRSTLFRLEPLDRTAIRQLVDRGTAGRSGDRRRRRARPAGRAGGRRRPAGADRPRGGVRPERLRARGTPSRRGGAGHECAALRPRRSLRRRQRIHQVDAGIRSRRRGVLARPDARGRRGRPVHRPAHDHLRQRGRRPGRQRCAHRRRRRGPCAGARRVTGGAVEPVAGGDLPGDRAEEQSVGARDLERRARRSATVRWARFRRICATRTTRRRPRSATASATSILTTMPVPSSISSTCPTNSSTAAGTSRARTATSRRSADG